MHINKEHHYTFLSISFEKNHLLLKKTTCFEKNHLFWKKPLVFFKNSDPPKDQIYLYIALISIYGFSHRAPSRSESVVLIFGTTLWYKHKLPIMLSEKFFMRDSFSVFKKMKATDTQKWKTKHPTRRSWYFTIIKSRRRKNSKLKVWKGGDHRHELFFESFFNLWSLINQLHQ